MGWVDPLIGLVRSGWLGRVGSRFCSFRWFGLGWVDYDKFFDDYTTYNCMPIELLGSSGKVYILIICTLRRSLLLV